ncbi:MAG: hypothetical protein ACRDJO_11025 [Actinomycetota bacterium]
MERPPLRGATGWQGQGAKPGAPDWRSVKPKTPPDVPAPRLKPPSNFDRYRAVPVVGGRVDNTAALMRELDYMRRLVEDDSWMDNMSREELIAIRDRARLVAGNLSSIQKKLKPFKKG